MSIESLPPTDEELLTLLGEELAALSPDNLEHTERIRRIGEEIAFLVRPVGKLGGRLATHMITERLIDPDDPNKGTVPLLPYDENNVVHRVARAQGYTWSDVTRQD